MNRLGARRFREPLLCGRLTSTRPIFHVVLSEPSSALRRVSCSNRALTMAMIPTSWPPMVPDATASMDEPSRERMPTALPPGVPLWSPAMERPEPSWRPAGGCPLTWSWTGLVTANGLLGISVTVSFAELNTADFSLIALAFCAVRNLLAG